MKCSFCRRRDSEVEKLVAGPRRLLGRVYICDRCATQTIQIMNTHPVEPPSGRVRRSSKSRWFHFFALQP
jgi:ATP-dependent protease Clp ATPase subunit